ncbi:MAG: sigma-70 family RNA polymerase sigma factor [Candidatus Rokubacteria bacterium]|nr:sigma-70 family RNA polymerase sigma factor [Candidatus Rokubacteria bacterium]
MRDEDLGLVERCRAGDLTGFEALVEKYKRRAYRLAYQVLRDQEEALDVAQEAFIKAYQSLPRFRGQSAFYTWLFRIIVNLAMDRHRQRVARQRAFGAEEVPPEEWERLAPAGGAGPEDEAARAEQRRRIETALGVLPPHHRSIIILSDIEGLSYREIADVLEIPLGTVMSRLHNARKRLRRLLGPMLVGLFALSAFLGPGAGEGLAQPEVLAQQMVRVGARILLASNPPPTVAEPAPPGLRKGFAPLGEERPPLPEPPTREPDERLQRILPRLRELFRYSTYETVDRFSAEVPMGTAQRFALPGGREIEVTPMDVRGRTVRMHVKLLRGGLAEMAAVIHTIPGQPALIGGPPHGPGVLIIILWAHPGS